MIMSMLIRNSLQEYRRTRGWSQDELAHRSRLSRTAISAIETGRVVPSTAAALALAAAFDCRVEDLFRLGTRASRGGPKWAWAASNEAGPFWRARVGEDTWLYPVERTAIGTLPPDGVLRADAYEVRTDADAERTLV